MPISKTLCAIAGSVLPALSLTAQDRPNIIFFLIDDYGWTDSEVAYGERCEHNLNFHTPNMLALASKGVVFSNAYACPVSTPTRTSIMSGMNAIHSHITNWTSMAKDEPSDAVGGANGAVLYEEKASDVFRRPEWNINGLSPVPGIAQTAEATPLVDLLKQNGYFTIHVGKAHLASAGTPGSSPLNWGFVTQVAGTNAGLPCSYQGNDNFGNTPEKWNMSAVQNMTEYYGHDIFLTEALTREALKTLDYPVSHGQPFYLYMSHYATHTPIQKDKRFFRRYKDMGMDDGEAKFASMVEGVDKSLGDIMNYLDEKGISDNTVIILMGDNGGNADAKGRGGERHTQNKPLREGKGSCYEGGIRVPMMFYYPGKTPAGVKISTPVVPEDLYPTILDVAKVKSYSTVQDVDGQSLLPMLTEGAKMPSRPIFFHYPHQWKVEFKPEVDFLSTVILDDWKLVYVMSNAVPGVHVDPGLGKVSSPGIEKSRIKGVRCGALELYNLKDDIGESVNVAGKYPEKVKELATILSGRLRAWNASMPTIKATGESVPMPDELF